MKKEIYPILVILILVAVIFSTAIFFYKNSNSEVGEASKSQATSRVSNDVLLRDWSPSIGPTMSRVVIVEFLDPECESCRAMHPLLKEVLKRYEGRVRYVLRYMAYHQNSELAARWLEAAREQNLYWESLDALFESQPEWAAHHAPRPDLIPQILKSVGVDVEKARLAKDNPKFADWISKDKADGTSAGVSGTPTFFVNGMMLKELGETPLVTLIEAELNGK